MLLKLISVGGIGVFILLATLMARAGCQFKFRWRLVGVSLLLQSLIALVFLGNEWGRAAFNGVNMVFLEVSKAGQKGAAFLFGSLVEGKIGPESAPIAIGCYVAFGVLPVVVFLSALTSLLYHWGVMQFVIRSLGGILRRSLGISAAEAFCASANIFVGQTEAPLVIRPYLATMSRPQLMCVLITGMSTIAGSVLVAYVAMFQDRFPQIGGHLMAASIMSAPAAIMFAKILEPNDGSEVDEASQKLPPLRQANAIEALVVGTQGGISLAVNIATALITFIAMLSLINWIWGALLALLGRALGLDVSGFDSLQEVGAILMWPFALLMGVPVSECSEVALRLSERVLVSDFLAYENFSKSLANSDGSGLSDRTRVILSYALCGFAGIPSVGVIVGGIAIICPTRRAELAQLAFRAMIGALLACFTTACIAGLFI